MNVPKKIKQRLPFYHQLDGKDCGAACLKMIAAFHDKKFSIQYLRELAHISRLGVSLLGISNAAEKIGMRTLAARVNYHMLAADAPLPCIVHWNQNHFIVVCKIKKGKVFVADPAVGYVKYSKEEFCKGWYGSFYNDDTEGVLLLLAPTPDFYKATEEGKTNKATISFLFKYLKPHKNLLFQLALGLASGSLLSLVMPFLTQALVDYGINDKDINFVYLILIAQIMFFVGRTSISLIRSWVMLHMSTRISIALVSDFLIKLMKLPVSFFDTKNLGDILQRIRDNDRIKSFLTSSSLDIVFSMFNLALYSFVMLYYNLELFLIFFAFTIIYVAWIIFFLSKRKQIDYRNFNQSAANKGNEVQLIQGMQEIKLNNCERRKRWEWESIQIRLFKVQISSLTLEQVQGTGSSFINELKNILITFWTAKEVIDGSMTLGMMMAAQQILGQLNAPVMQLVQFVRNAQDAKISLERLGEIHNKDDEDQDQGQVVNLPERKTIRILNLCFRYEGPDSEIVLKKLNLVIPQGKTTALVGASGSGKTTLLKLLLKFYEPESGEILIGDTSLRNIDSQEWRSKCGVVMQDGFIFSDTIAGNIAMADEDVDVEKLVQAADTANIRDFIESLPQNYNTRIGPDGLSLSQGQKQRILIARVIYKDPEILFFDEATSSLDTKNEREITNRLIAMGREKTLVVIAHRLSTVKNADQIVVLDQGTIKEIGSHLELTKQKGLYYELVKDQLELNIA